MHLLSRALWALEYYAIALDWASYEQVLRTLMNMILVNAGLAWLGLDWRCKGLRWDIWYLRPEWEIRDGMSELVRKDIEGWSRWHRLKGGQSPLWLRGYQYDYYVWWEGLLKSYCTISLEVLLAAKVMFYQTARHVVFYKLNKVKFHVMLFGWKSLRILISHSKQACFWGM